MAGRSAARRTAVCAGFWFLAHAAALHAAGDWQVPEASIRYKLTLERKPTHASAGYFVHLPDGGILHGTAPTTTVVGEDGKVIPSYLLWQNSESGFDIVFADPGAQARAVTVYAQAGRIPQLWKPETGLTPSAILCAWPGRETIAAAQGLAKFGHVESAVHSSDNPGIPKAPFSIGGDYTGRPKPGCFYQVSYLDANVAGDYWIAPIIRSGQCEIFVDGSKLASRERSKEWGGTGATVTFTAGLHRVEVFQTAPGTGLYSSSMGDGGLMYLAWRHPKEIIKSAEARVVTPQEIVHSGECKLTSVDGKDGAPVAAAALRPNLCFWFENEEPLIIYDLEALNSQPGVTWTWTFPEGGTIEGAKVRWLFPGFRESKVKVTAKSSQGVSSAVLTLFGFSTQPTSLDKAPTREAFREIMATMLAAFPHNPDPVSEWSDSWWNNLMRTVDGGEGYPLLLSLFSDHLEAARKKLSPGQLYTLEDMFLDEAVRKDPKAAFQWMVKLQPGSADTARQNELRMRQGELQMYYLGDHKGAEKQFTALAVLPGEVGERAKIRLGDLAFMDGDLNKATGYYADVQNRARLRRNSAPAMTDGLVSNQLVKGGPPSATPSNWRDSPLALQNQPKPNGAAAIPDLKGGALQDVSFSENVRTLIEGGYILEAQQALKAWEIEFPLSKISSDYILRESALAMKTGDWKRAQPMLEAYCREIDASSFLPDAASMLIACVNGAKEPPSSIREIIEKVKGRLKYHPVAAELDRFLSTASKPSP